MLGLELQSNTLVAWKQISAGLDLTGSVLWSRLAATQEAIPTQSAWAGTGLAFLRTSIRKNDAFEVFVRGRTMAPTAANLQATIEVPAFLRADLGVNYRLFDEAVISLSVDNVFDDRSLETLNKLPLPGRAFLASVRVFDLAKK